MSLELEEEEEDDDEERELELEFEFELDSTMTLAKELSVGAMHTERHSLAVSSILSLGSIMFEGERVLAKLKMVSKLTIRTPVTYNALLFL